VPPFFLARIVTLDTLQAAMKFSLSVIAHNEALHARRFLDSFAPLFEELCICYAHGSAEPDDTRKIVKHWCAANGKAYRETRYANQLHPEWPHVDNFSNARQASRNLATGDVWFWADFDDIIEDAKRLRAEVEVLMGKGAEIVLARYVLPHTSEESKRERFVRAGVAGRWVNPIHEIWKADVIPTCAAAETPIIHAPLDNEAKDPNRNMRILTAQMERATNTAYDLHRENYNRWMVSGSHDHAGEARRWGDIALADPRLEPEFRLQILCQLTLCTPHADTAKKYGWDAIRYRPDRREPYFSLAEVELNCALPDRAIALASAGTTFKKPENMILPVNGYWYSWGGYDVLCRAYRGSGRTAELEAMEAKMREKCGIKISVLHATRRAQKANWIRKVWMQLADNPAAVEWIFGIDHDDTESAKVLYCHPLVKVETHTCVAAWNACAAASKGEILVQMSDDFEPRRGWDTMLLDLLDPTKEQVLDLRDKQRGDDLLTMAILTRARYARQGFMFSPEYESMYSDNEYSYRAKRDGVLVPARGLSFPHHHPAHGKGEWDAVYTAQNAPERYARGLDTFRRRNPEAVAKRARVEVFTIATPAMQPFIDWQAEKLDMPRQLIAAPDAHDGCEFGQVPFNRICWQKVQHVAQRLLDPNGPEYLVHLDADIVLNQPLSVLVTACINWMDTSDRWIAGAHDPDTGLCGGFFVIRACAESVAFALKWAGSATDEANDQILLNHLLREAKVNAGLLGKDAVGSYGNTVGGVWDGDTAKLEGIRAPDAWHCNYVIGVERKLEMARHLRQMWAVQSGSESKPA
jgi:hypothetical protein